MKSSLQNFARTRINLSTVSKNKLSDFIFKWVVGGGRIIIVLTELVALGALFYRFVIDGQIVDLHDEIKREELIVKSQEKKEIQYRSIQARLSSIENLSREASSKVNTLNTLVSSIESKNITVETFSMNQNVIIIEGKTVAIFTLNEFVEILKKSKDIKTINIDDITNRKTGIDFKIIIEVENG